MSEVPVRVYLINDIFSSVFRINKTYVQILYRMIAGTHGFHGPGLRIPVPA